METNLPTQNGTVHSGIITINRATPVIRLNDIIIIEGKENYSLIQTKTRSIICSKSLKFFEETIADKRFIRTHKSHIVNLDYVHRHRLVEGIYRLELLNGKTVNVARRRSGYVALHIK